MDFDNFFTTLYIRNSDYNLTVESARSEKRRVKDVRSVGCRQNNNSGVLRKAIHFNQKLVKCLFSFVVTAADSCSSFSSDRINFVDKDDARRVFLRLVEQVSDSGRADADEHFNEIRTADCEERYACFARGRSGDIGFSGSRRAYQQNSLRNSGSEFSVFSRIFQEVNNLRKLLFFFFQPCNIVKGNFLVTALDHLRLRLRELERFTVSALIHHDIEQENQRSDHDHIRNQRPQP